MALTETLGTGLDATSNPDPNTLTTKAPYDLTEARREPSFNPSSAWTTQAQPGLFPMGNKDGQGELGIKLHFVPSAGAATTYTIKLWMYNPVSNSWAMPYSNGTKNYTGEVVDYVSMPGHDALFIEIDTISAGTLGIYFDPSNARKG